MADEPIALRGMGSFYVGGRTVEVSGEPIRDLVLSPGGVPLRLQTSVVDLSAVIHRITTERWAVRCSQSVGSPNRQSHSPPSTATFCASAAMCRSGLDDVAPPRAAAGIVDVVNRARCRQRG